MKPNQKSEVKIFQYPPFLPNHNSENQTYSSLDFKEKIQAIVGMPEYLQNESYAVCHIISSINKSKRQIKLERTENHKIINEIIHQYAS